jgi:tryptophan halogenase
MEETQIKDIVIVGGGTAGWMTAAAMGKMLNRRYRITVIESDEISTVGVGEATIPKIKLFNMALGLDENEFIKFTQGTFKLGIEFVNWGKIGESYIHGFGGIGDVPDLQAYSLNNVAAKHDKFMRAIDAGNSPLSRIANAFHFDAGLYARYLRLYAEAHGVVRREGKIIDTLLRDKDGFVDAVVMEDGEKISGDLFIDCSGFRGLLIEQALKTGYEDWSHWLPCDRAIAIPTAISKPPTPYTRATAHKAGWQWRIPLQHRVGNGHVYSSRFISDDEATSILLSHLDAPALAEPRMLKFTTGRRKKCWNKNVVAIGLSSGFMEPLESTSIHLIQSSVARLLSLLPNRDFDQTDIDEYNRQCDYEVERIRDFLILHYKATQRDDSAFWNYCRTMDIPPELARRIKLYESNGRIYRDQDELFATVAWLQVMHGQGLKPKAHHPLAELLTPQENLQFLEIQKSQIDQAVTAMPSHADFIAKHCAAPSTQRVLMPA